MFRTALLQVSRLEEREVPVAGMFADIFPGVWGSYPLNLTPSGNTLFFSADNGHGYELYATDGTTGSARMLKDVKPGLGGSNPSDFYPADGGVVYFTADNGTGRALWRSDGTAAGTTKVPGLPADDTFGGNGTGYRPQAVGLNGSLYFLTTTPGSGDVRLWKTDGAATTLLHDFGPSSSALYTTVGISGGLVAVTLVSPGANAGTVWVSDGTAAGTRPQQQPLTANDPKYGSVGLGTGVVVSPGLFVHPTALSYATGNTATLWTSDGVNPASARLLAAFAPGGPGSSSVGPLVPLGSKLYFVVDSVSPTNRGLWVTDGTAPGTQHLTLPIDVNFSDIQAFNGKLLLRAIDDQSHRYRFWLTDGTAAGTAEIPLPDAPTPTSVIGTSVGRLPAGPGFPNGALVFHLGADGRPYLTDGTADGGRWTDTTGLPTGYPTGTIMPQLDGAGRAVSGSAPAGVYFNGAIYFQSPRVGDDRPELWQWDLSGTVKPPPAPGPKVTSVTVNDGSAQRSMVTSLTIAFDRPLAADDGAISIKDATGKSIPVYPTLAPSAGGGTVLQIAFGTSPGVSLPDGRYTLTVGSGKVRDAGTGATMAADYAFTFTRLFGDLNGDGTYDREARALVHNSLGLHIGDAGYLAALDVNSDGLIDATDELAVVRNWGKSV